MSAAHGADGETPASPPGDATATQVLDIDALMALLAGLTTAGAEGGPNATTATSIPEMPLLDRPAGAEAEPTGTEPGAAALETLMAALLLVRPEPTPAVEHSLPGGDLVLPAAMTTPPTIEVAGSLTDATATVASGEAEVPAMDAGTLPAVPQPGATAMTDATSEALTPPTAAAQAAAATDEDGQPADDTAAVAVALAGEPDAPMLTTSAPAQAEPVEASAETAEPRAESVPVTADAATEDDRAEVEIVTAQPSQPAPTTTSNDARQAAAVTAPSVPSETVSRPEPARTVSASNPVPDLADSVRSAVIGGDTEVRLRLDPPEMGSLEIHIERQDGAIRIRVEATQASARDVIEQALPALQQALEARDLRVDRLEVRSMSEAAGGRQMTEQGGQFGRGQQPQQDGTPEWSPVAAIDGVRRDAPANDGRTGDGRLDVMA